VSLADDIAEVLIPADQLQARVLELGTALERDYQGRNLLLVGVLKGAVMFMVDLARSIDMRVDLDFMAISSYGDQTVSSGVVRLIKDLDGNIEGRDVVIVEDIVDTGLTLSYIREILLAREPASLRICALLDKHEARKTDVPLDYIGFRIPSRFVVGYGLDYAGTYRNLPFIGVLKPEKYQNAPQ
jgi:hypoxanthine phosphoribosyltransferase